MRSIRLASLPLFIGLLLCLQPQPTSAINGKCRALALSGGGDRAAYEVGVLRGLVSLLPTEETSYDVVTGISAGSCVTGAFSAFPIGKEAGAVELGHNIIAELNQSSIFTNWKDGGIIEGLVNKSSLFDSTPLRKLYENVLLPRPLVQDRIVCMGAVKLRDGEFNRFCHHQSMSDVVTAVLASAAIPGVFIPQAIDGEMYIDGGLRVNVDIIGAIQQCASLGYAQKDIIVDAVECGGMNLTDTHEDPSKMTTVPIWLQAAVIHAYVQNEPDYAQARLAFPQVNYRYRIWPSKPIPGSSIDFNPKIMKWMEQLGESDAANAIKPALRGIQQQPHSTDAHPQPHPHPHHHAIEKLTEQ